jgi:pimeloyl-ACP methyl ester carboxylesterase
VLSAASLLQLSRAQAASQLKNVGLPSGARYGITAYRVTYCTISPAYQPVTASGLLVLPQDRHGTIPLVSYDHSTVAKKDDAPSDLDTDEIRGVSLLFASDGFAVAAPDYLGLGSGPGLHPYMQASSEASATIDMLTAADQVSAQHQARLSRKVFLTGFSQGGQAAMATGQALQASHSPWTVAALAPVSGPYDLDAEFPAMFDANRVDPHRASGYIAYILTAWNRLYHLYASPQDVFTASTAGKINSLFDGKQEIDAIAAVLPPATGLLQPAWRTLIEHPTGRLAAAVRANQVCHWAPREPVRLYASHGDHDVVFANVQACLREIEDMGGRAQIEDVGEVNHVGSALVSLPLVRTWFSQLAS